jgi:hypothetical protein
MPTVDILRREADIRSFKQGETIFKEGGPRGLMDNPAALPRWQLLIAALPPLTKKDS